MNQEGRHIAPVRPAAETLDMGESSGRTNPWSVESNYRICIAHLSPELDGGPKPQLHMFACGIEGDVCDEVAASRENNTKGRPTFPNRRIVTPRDNTNVDASNKQKHKPNRLDSLRIPDSPDGFLFG